MSGVWVFKNNGVIRLVENPHAENQGAGSSDQPRIKKKILVHLPSGQVITSYRMLERILKDLGWETYNDGDPELIQFDRKTSIDLISLPRDFSKFSSIYMYDIIVKNSNVFQVRDM